MANPNNPAGRLYNLLKEREKPSFQKMKVRDVWCVLLGVGVNDTPILLRRIAKVIALPSLIEQQIKQNENIDHSVYLKWLPKVANAFKRLNLEAPWTNFIKPIDDTVVYGLEICSEQLSRKQPETIIKYDEIKKIQGEIDELLHEITSSNIDKYLKEYLTTHIKDIMDAIEEYELEGIVPIRKALESTIGAMVIQPEIHQEIKVTKLNKKFWTILRKVALIVSLAVNTIQIAEDTIPLLPDPETNIEESLHKETNQIEEGKFKDSQSNTIQI